MNELNTQVSSKTANPATAIFVCVSLLAAFVGLMAAAFGSQADVSPSASGAALYLGIALVLLGFVGAWVQLKIRDIRISTFFLVIQVISFAILLGVGP